MSGTSMGTIAGLRESFLNGSAPPGHARDEVFASWRRSTACSVDSQRVRPSIVAGFEGDGRLLRAADAVIADALDSFQDLGVAFMLSDGEGRILGRWAAENDVLAWLDSVYAVEGSSYAEDVVGNNAIGTALELGRPSRFDGHEHFVADFHGFTCVGIPLRDPISQRLRGVLDVTAGVDPSNRLIDLVADRMARSIEERLGDDIPYEDRLLVQQFVQARRRVPGVLAMNQRTVLSDPRASRLLGAVNQADLWEHARDAVELGTEATRTFTGTAGETLRAVTVPLRSGGKPFGVLMRVSVETESARALSLPVPIPAFSPDFVGTSPAIIAAFTRAWAAFIRRGVLLRGGPGVGKLHMARELHQHRGTGPLQVADASECEHGRARAWLAELRLMLSGEPGTAAVRHVESLPDAAAVSLVHALRGAVGRGWRVVLTARGEDGPRVCAGFLDEVQIPTLDSREGDIEALAAHFAHPRTVTPEAMHVLRRVPWPGNVHQLEGAMRGLQDVEGTPVTPGSLPPEIRNLALRRNLSRMERVQLREMLSALQECSGNRQQAAESLGISRSTLYRRLRDAGIDLDTTNF